jgi:hypothetical protein
LLSEPAVLSSAAVSYDVLWSHSWVWALLFLDVCSVCLIHLTLRANDGDFQSGNCRLQLWEDFLFLNDWFSCFLCSAPSDSCHWEIRLLGLNS